MGGRSLVLSRVGLTRGGIPVLDGCDAEFPSGSITHLSGSNGSGKTTLLRVCAGLLRPQTGAVRRPAGGVAYVPDIGASNTPVPVAAFRGAVLAGQPRRIHRAVGPLLEQLGYSAPSGARPGELSRGNRQKLLLGLAIASERPVVLADEPLSGMDAASRPGALALLSAAAGAGRTVLVTGHSAGERPEGARYLRLEGGRCREGDPPSTARPRLAVIRAVAPAGLGSLPDGWLPAAGDGGFSASCDADTGVWTFSVAPGARRAALQALLGLGFDIVAVGEETG